MSCPDISYLMFVNIYEYIAPLHVGKYDLIDEIEGNNDGELVEDDPPAAELRFVPDDKSTRTKCINVSIYNYCSNKPCLCNATQLKENNNYNIYLMFLVNDIYAAICDCQILHPDEQEQLEDEMAGNMSNYQNVINRLLIRFCYYLIKRFLPLSCFKLNYLFNKYDL